MKIQSVSNYASSGSFSSVRNVMNNTTPFRGGGLEASTNSINLLMDKNYNSAFIKPQSLSFKGLGSLPDIEGTNPIEDKISTVLGFSETDDVVVVGKDIETVKKDLAENIDTIPKVINRILFIPDESAETSFMVANNLFNVPYLQNL